MIEAMVCIIKKSTLHPVTAEKRRNCGIVRVLRYWYFAILSENIKNSDTLCWAKNTAEISEIQLKSENFWRISAKMSGKKKYIRAHDRSMGHRMACPREKVVRWSYPFKMNGPDSHIPRSFRSGKIKARVTQAAEK